jgi:hypothetical protein
MSRLSAGRRTLAIGHLVRIPHEDKLLVLINRAYGRNLTAEPNTIDLVTTEMTKLVNVVASDGLMAINFRLRSSRSINAISDEEPR